MAGPSFKSFLAVALVCSILLSLAWIWLGKGYNTLLLEMLSPFTSDGVSLARQGHDIQLSVASPAGSEPGPVGWDIHSMAMIYGLIVAASVLLAVPRIGLRDRLILVAGAALIAFISHIVGLYLLVESLESVARDATQSAGTLPRTLFFAWLFIPSLVWLPALLRQWNPLRVSNPSGQHSRRPI